MNLIVYDGTSFEGEPIPTEATALRLLTERPLEADVNYLAVPWSRILDGDNGGWQTHFPRLRQLRLNGGFTICQHIMYRQIVHVCQRIGLDVIFSPHVEASLDHVPLPMRHRTRRALRALPRLCFARETQLLPFPHTAVNAIVPAPEKDIWFSFVGADTHPTRREIFELPTRPDAEIVERNDWHFYETEAQKRRQRRQFQEILARSRFSLCPRGTGASTVRFWESLAAGAIPVLISDQMTLPVGFKWQQCLVQIRESEVRRVEEVLRTISNAQEQKMRALALEAYRRFSGQQFVSCVRDHFDKHQQAA